MMFKSCPSGPHAATHNPHSMHLSMSRAMAGDEWSRSSCENSKGDVCLAPPSLFSPLGVRALIQDRAAGSPCMCLPRGTFGNRSCSSSSSTRDCSLQLPDTSHDMHALGCRASSSSPSVRRKARSSSESVLMTSPSAAGVAQAGRGFAEPSTSTRHILQTAFGLNRG